MRDIQLESLGVIFKGFNVMCGAGVGSTYVIARPRLEECARPMKPPEAGSLSWVTALHRW